MVVVLVVSIVRKAAQSERDCSLTKKKKKKLATVSIGYFSLEKRRLKIQCIRGILQQAGSPYVEYLGTTRNGQKTKTFQSIFWNDDLVFREK